MQSCHSRQRTLASRTLHRCHLQAKETTLTMPRCDTASKCISCGKHRDWKTQLGTCAHTNLGVVTANMAAVLQLAVCLHALLAGPLLVLIQACKKPWCIFSEPLGFVLAAWSSEVPCMFSGMDQLCNLHQNLNMAGPLAAMLPAGSMAMPRPARGSCTFSFC